MRSSRSSRPCCSSTRGDRGLLREIRNTLSPDTFVIGRIFVDLGRAARMLDGGDPEGAGRAFAERIINYDFGLAQGKGQQRPAARRRVDEPQRAGAAARPASSTGSRTPRRWRATTRSTGSRPRSSNGCAPTGWKASHSTSRPATSPRRTTSSQYFPRSLAAYTYLGFHEYGWPTLMPRPETSSSARCSTGPLLDGIRETLRQQAQADHHGGRARPHVPLPAGPGGRRGLALPRRDDSRGRSTGSRSQWYNAQMAQDDYVMGACLYQVGHSGRWETFRHLGVDNQRTADPADGQDRDAARHRDAASASAAAAAARSAAGRPAGRAAGPRATRCRRRCRKPLAHADAFTRDVAGVKGAL